MTHPQDIEYWELTGNPSGEIYCRLISFLCRHSDRFYFVTRKELICDPAALERFMPYVARQYKSKTWAGTQTKGPAATIYEMEVGDGTCRLLQESANSLYEWTAPRLPEDLTFIKNGFTWFSCTTHEETAGFWITPGFRKQLDEVPGLHLIKA